jgi:hypothetical protein
VLTHLPSEHIKECFRHIVAVMDDNTTFYFTFAESQEPRQLGIEGFGYPFGYFAELAMKYGYDLADVANRSTPPRPAHGGTDQLAH